MKKAITLIIGIVISMTTFSQTFYKVLECSYSKYYNDSWTKQETNHPQSMFVIMNKDKIKITNEDESNFILYGEMEIKEHSTHTSYSWDSYDKDGKQCVIIMKKNKDDQDELGYLSIVYGLTCIEYVIKLQN